MADRPWVEWLGVNAGSVGIVAYLYENDPRPGLYVSAKVKAQIAESDALVVLLTVNSQYSAYVQQEIGVAEGLGKLVIPLVQPGVDQRALAMLAGIWGESPAPGQYVLAELSFRHTVFLKGVKMG